MNKKGQLVFLGIMIGLLVIITLISISGSLKSVVDLARTEMDCSNTSISDATVATCIVSDWTFFGFIGTGIIVGITYIYLRKLQTANQGFQ